MQSFGRYTMLLVSSRKTAAMCLKLETEGDAAVMVLMLVFKSKVSWILSSTDHVELITVTQSMMRVIGKYKVVTVSDYRRSPQASHVISP